MNKWQFTTVVLTILAMVSTALGDETKTSYATINDAAKAIVKRGLSAAVDEKSSLAVTTDALGLLATGNEAHLTLIQEFARKRAKACEALDVMDNRAMQTREAGLLNVFLCEYYLITKDDVVMSGVRALSTYLAFGQSGVGTWGTEIPDVKANGLYGQAVGMSSNDEGGTDGKTALMAAISLSLARKCGVTAQPVSDAIERSKGYYRFYVDKGGVPVNRQNPNKHYNSQNRSAHAAIFFQLEGGKKAAAYFTRMTLADKGKGPRFMADWSKEGNQLLDLCQSRGVLMVSRSAEQCVELLTPDEVKKSIAAGAFKAKKATEDQLLAALSSWSPRARDDAAREIAKRKLEVADKVIDMLKSDNRFAQYGACTVFRYRDKPLKLAEMLSKILQTSNDETLLHFALHAIAIRYSKDSGEWKAAVIKEFPNSAKVVYRDRPNKDRFGRIATQFAEVTIHNLHRNEFQAYFKAEGQGADVISDFAPVETLIPMLKVLLNCPFGSSRVAALRTCITMNEKDLEPLYEDVYFACTTVPPHPGIKSWTLKTWGYSVLAKLRFEETFDLSFDYIKEEGGEFGFAMVALSQFPLGNLKPHWDRLEPLITPFMAKEIKGGHMAGWQANWKKLLEAKAEAIELRSIKQYLSEAGIKAHKLKYPKDFE